MKNIANGFKNLYNTRTDELSSLLNAHRNLSIKVNKLRKNLDQAKNGLRRGLTREGSVKAIEKTINVTRKNMKTITKKWRDINRKVKKVEKSLILRMAKNLSSTSKK